MFLGFLFSLIVHAFIEMYLIIQMLEAGRVPFAYSQHEFLPPFLSFILTITGLAFGYVAGVRWWQWIYVEKRHWIFRKNKKKTKRKITARIKK
jgi:hypothetical protein